MLRTVGFPKWKFIGIRTPQGARRGRHALPGVFGWGCWFTHICKLGLHLRVIVVNIWEMTRRKENILIAVSTVVALSLLTWWRASVLTMQKDTGPLPEGQRSLKPVEMYVESGMGDMFKELMTAYELAHGIQVKRIPLQTSSVQEVKLPDLNASRILLLSESQRGLWEQLPNPWEESPVLPDEELLPEGKVRLFLIHFPESKSDPNVTEVIQYLTSESQVDLLYGNKSR